LEKGVKREYCLARGGVGGGEGVCHSREREGTNNGDDGDNDDDDDDDDDGTKVLLGFRWGVMKEKEDARW
jgi:hypothetical protein